MEKTKEERVRELDGRIADLKKHESMWAKAGGHGGMMAMNANAEVKELELEREDLINGTSKLAIYRIEKELERLTYLRRDANIFQRMSYNSKIKKLEKELYALKDKDRNIKVANESIEMDEEQLTQSDLDHAVAVLPDEVALEIARSNNLLNNRYINDESINVAVDEEELTQEDLDHVVGALPDEVALEMAKSNNLLNNMHINDEPINMNESMEMEEKGKNR